MPTFTPPLTDGRLVGDPGDPTWPLYRFFGSWATGKTVWKDSLGVWHAELDPYLGGAVHTVHDGATTTVTGPDEGLATAQEVYQGGHVHPITDTKASELMAAGFTVGGHWDTEEARWSNFAINSVVNKEYKGGDSAASLYRPETTSLWVFADNFIGTVTAGGLYIAALPARNALLVRAADGTITQSFPEGNFPAWTNPTGGNWWWPIDIINDGAGTGGDAFVACWEVTTGGNFGHLLRNEILQLGIFGNRVASFEVETDGTFFVQAVYKDDTSGFHYLLGLEYDLERGGVDTYSTNTRTFTRLARCPIGNLASIASAIQYWNGTAWTSSPAALPRFVDVHGNPIDGTADLTKVGATWVLMTMTTATPNLTLWRSPAVTGPWTRFHVTDSLHNPPAGGSQPTSPSQYAYYLPKFHEHLNPNAAHLVATYNRNIFTAAGQTGNPPLTDLHVSTFTPQFVYLPAPEP